MVPYDPEFDSLPEELEEFGGRSVSAIGPAILFIIGARARKDGWAQRVVTELATAWTDQGHRITLVDLDLNDPQLHTEIGEENAEGVADIFQFGASLGSVARMVPGRGWRFVPAGAYIADPPSVLRSSAWDDIIGQVADERSSLLLYLPADDTGALELASRVGRVIVLAAPDEAEAIVAEFSPISNVELLIGPQSSKDEEVPIEEADPKEDRELVGPPLITDQIETDLTEPPTIPRRRRRRAGVGTRVVQLLAILVLIVGGLLLFDEFGALPGGLELPDWARLGSQPVDEDPTFEELGLTSADPIEEELAEPAEPVEEPIPYSVAVEAHPNYLTALERLEVLQRAEPEIGFFLSPILNQDLIYYRVLAGPVADTTAAWDLMRRLVAAKQKTDLDPWSIRPTIWAYHLGDFESEERAEARRLELQEEGIPSYWVEIEYTHGPPRYRLYAGAYEGPAPAEVMAEILEEAGIDAPLVHRHGKPRP